MDLVARLAVALAVDECEELDGGHQSRVFRVSGRHGLAVAKVLDASMVKQVDLAARLDVTAALADIDPQVCRPLLVDGRRITELTSPDGRHYVVCHQFAAGTQPDPARPPDAERMGVALANLHESMRRLPAFPLPVVGALRAGAADEATDAGAHQLLHGDFNAGNLRLAGDAVRIFDLDDCGYGPPAFDVANALYMVLFDAFTRGPVEIYETFRPFFLAGYTGVPGPSLAEGPVDRFIDRRVRALGAWLDDLASAPIGIRTASSAWHATLRSFVDGYRPIAD